MTRGEALDIMEEFVQNNNLRKHMLSVEAAMKAYAEVYHGNAEEWGIVGLLHDFDWEIHPTMDEHPAEGQAILESRGVPEHLRRAIMAHAPHTGVVPLTDMEKCIFAVDELSGFIVACALVQPQKTLAEVSVESVQRKLKNKGFAAKVNRLEIQQGTELLGRPAHEHIQTVLQALQSIHLSLGL